MEQPEGQEQSLDWSALPGPCKQLVINLLCTVSRAAFRRVSRQTYQDINAWTRTLTWKGSDEVHLSSVSAPDCCESEPDCLPLALMASLPSLQQLVCDEMYKLTTIHGIPHSLRSLDLASCNSMLDLSHLRHCTALEQLVLWGLYNHWQQVAKTLTPLTPGLGRSLRKLTIRLAGGSDASDETHIEVLHSLSHLTRLQHLALGLPTRYTPPSTKDFIWGEFAALLLRMTGLQVLDLIYNFVGKPMSSIAAAIAQLPQLHTLRLASNAMGFEECLAVGNAIAALQPGLTHLDLRCNTITTAGFRALGLALRPRAATLTTLQLDSTQMGSAGIETLAATLGCCSALQHLGLASSALEDKGAIALAQPLINIASSLTYLDLSRNDITPPGFEALAPALAAMASLQHLSLTGNMLGHAGAAALRATTSLEHLDVHDTKLCCEGLKSLAPALHAMPRLRYWDVSGNHLSTEGSRFLAAFVPTLPALAKLRISRCDLRQCIDLPVRCPGLTLLTAYRRC